MAGLGPHEQLEAIMRSGFQHRATQNGSLYFELDLGGGATVCLEPLIYERGGFALGAYRDGVLVGGGKIVLDVKGLRGGGGSDDG